MRRALINARRWLDPERASKHIEYGEHLAELSGRLAAFHLDQKAYADTRRRRQLILTKALRAPYTANELSNLLGTHPHIPDQERYDRSR